jgi:hypothetical protein
MIFELIILQKKAIPTYLARKNTQTIVEQTKTKQNWYQVSSSNISANAESKNRYIIKNNSYFI